MSKVLSPLNKVESSCAGLKSYLSRVVSSKRNKSQMTQSTKE